MAKKCDILYIHSGRNPKTSESTKYGIIPMGIISILNQIRDTGVNVIGINLALEFSIDPQFDLESVFKDIEYKILMTDLHWYEHSFGALYIVEQSKNFHPNIPTVIGGYTSTIYGNEIAENFPCVDYIVTGDSDLPMAMLTDYLLGRNDIKITSIPNLIRRQNDTIITSEEKWVQTTLEDLDCVRTDFFEHSEQLPFLCTGGGFRKSGAQWICVARGCLYNCAYCCGAKDNMNALFRRCNVIKRSPEKLAGDFYALAQKGIRVSPSHDFQMFGKDYYKELFARIRETGAKPGLYLECFQLPTKDFIDEISITFDNKNTILEISPISGNEQLRNENGKHFSNNDLYETVKYILAKKIYIQLYYTVNVVGETEAQFMDTYFQIKYLHLAFKLRDIFYQRIVLDPLAGMRKWDNFKSSYNTFMDYYNYCLIPQSEDDPHTGFDDGCAVPIEKKLKLYNSIFGK